MAGQGRERGTLWPTEAGPAPREARAPRPPRNWTWAALMRRAFALDVLACPRCGARLRVLATVDDPVVVRQILGLPRPAQTLGRARPPVFQPRPTD